MTTFKIEGNITEIFPIRSIRINGSWVETVDFILEDDYKDRYFFTLFGEKKTGFFMRFCDIGTRAIVKFKIRTSEGEEKWFTNLTATRVYNIKEDKGPRGEGPNFTYEEYV